MATCLKYTTFDIGKEFRKDKMKNKEKFADKIIDFACTRDNIAVNIKGEVVGCSSLICENCKFGKKEECKTAIKEWFEEEYVEPPVISSKDKRLLECIKGGYEYIARDYLGNMYLYLDKPKKVIGSWCSNSLCVSIKPFDVDFPLIKWGDKEPWLIDDLRKLEVCEDYEQTN